MITGYETFGLYQAIKLHFTTDSYDFFKYGGKSKISVDAFENRKDKYFFYKLSRRIKTKDELIDYIASQFVNDENCWIGNMLDETSDAIYRKRQKVIQSLSYIFENDCNKIFENVDNPNVVLNTDGNHPVLLTMVLQNKIEIETFCILNCILNFVPTWDKKIEDTIVWPLYKRKVIAYTPFIKFDKEKFKVLLKRAIHEKIIS